MTDVEKPRLRPQQWRVDAVTGRGSGPRLGLSPVHSMRLVDEAGGLIEIGRLVKPGARRVESARVHEVSPGWWNVCPICFEPNPTSDEHVPPDKLGGHRMTKTCKDCNQRMGSIVEAELVNYLDDSIGSVRFAGDAVPGRRRSSRILLRQSSKGEPFFIVEGGADPGVRTIFEAGGGTIEYVEPHEPSYRIAALKSAYLAACLALKDIPMTPSAQQIRADLVAARDSKRYTARSAIADRLVIMRGFEGAQGPTVGIGWARPEGGEAIPIISLAGVLAVSWPFDDVPFLVPDIGERAG